MDWLPLCEGSNSDPNLISTITTDQFLVVYSKSSESLSSDRGLVGHFSKI